jgi:hypothetical protein
MKHLLQTLKYLGALTLLTFAVSCATTTQSREDALVASGFKVISPKTPAQQAKLQALPADKVTQVTKDGKTYYVFPDVAHNQAYVGGPKQYQAYKSLRVQQKVAQENLEAASMNQAASMDFGGWGGWGMWGPVGWY